MSISKKIRFEVFKRDGFKCAYCGKTPPTVILEVDHIDPKSKGGKDDINNLLTSCFDCNRGKKDIPLSIAPAQMVENLQILREKEKQLAAYRRLAKKIQARTDSDIEAINQIYKTAFPGWELSEVFRNGSLKKFLSILSMDMVSQSLNIAIGRGMGKDRVIPYFCGICWNKIKGESNK